MSMSARSASFLLLASLASVAWCQDTGPSLLPLPPLPPAPGYTVSAATATNDALWGQPDPSPIPVVEPTLGGGQYVDAMKGDYSGGCTTCGPAGGSACCNNHYVYANALLMNRLRPGGFVTSVYGSGAQAINFCNQEFGNTWVGGFEVGAGWCFGCNCNNALEVVYWGLFPSTLTAQATGNINSLIDFGSLDYNGGNANNAFTNAGIQSAQSAYSFNSFEANLVGNSLCGGPFGCGMCGCCNGNSGSPWGMGYTLGFRYINFSDSFLFSSDPAGNAINGDPAELNYLGQFNNNLFGFQLGTGISYCVSNSLTAYVIGKVGVYDNCVTGLQRVYGTAGNATINNGPFTGQDAVVRTANRSTFAMSGQIDFGARYAITNNWSANMGYRVLGLSGVATADDNFQQANFHDVDGMAFLNRSGSLLIHGAYLGATYCF